MSSVFKDTVALTSDATAYQLSTLMSAIDSTFPSGSAIEVRVTNDAGNGSPILMGGSNVGTSHYSDKLLPGQSITERADGRSTIDLTRWWAMSNGAANQKLLIMARVR